jgi:Spy/CpxP family protein refolding chaperone
VQGSVQGDPIFQALFPPELIMQHRRAIALTDEQRDAISQLIQQLQGRVVRLQWELLDEMQQLTEVMSNARVDLDRALDQLDDVLETEKSIKQAHLEMLVRIKNLLTPEQQTTLDRLRSAPAP